MEASRHRTFVNSEQMGDFVDITMPGKDEQPGEQIRIHYLEAGNGEPLLLIHGIGQSLYTWHKVFGELSKYYRVVAMDLPGHGYSSRPEQFCYSMDEMTESIRLFMDAKDIESAHMVAFSTGAIYMLNFVKKYPQYSANCIAIAPGDITKNMPALFRYMKNPISAVFARNLFTESDVKKALYECVYDRTNMTDWDVAQYYEPIQDGLTRENLMYAVRNFDMKYVTENLKDVDHEVLILWGKEDKWHTPNNSVYFQGVLQNGRYFLVRNSGHLVQEDTPDKLLQVILSYIIPVHHRGRPIFKDLDIASRKQEQAVRPQEAPKPVEEKPVSAEEEPKPEEPKPEEPKQEEPKPEEEKPQKEEQTEPASSEKKPKEKKKLFSRKKSSKKSEEK